VSRPPTCNAIVTVKARPTPTASPIKPKPNWINRHHETCRLSMVHGSMLA
jgi:hypothetical protein